MPPGGFFCFSSALLLISGAQAFAPQAGRFNPPAAFSWLRPPAAPTLLRTAAQEGGGDDAAAEARPAAGAVGAACAVEALPDPPLQYLDLNMLKPRPEEKAREGAAVYPLFPLGGAVYLPNTEHGLNIFEPRYRKMYNDILLSGSRTFAVCMVGEDGRFAEWATLFYLQDLKEVSEQTQDQVKYVCQHKATRRVKVVKVLNPAAWTDRSTYLRVEVLDPLDPAAAAAAAAASSSSSQEVGGNDGGGGVENIDPEAEEDAASVAADAEELCRDMDEVVALQNAFKEEPRFSPQLKGVFQPRDFILPTAGEEDGSSSGYGAEVIDPEEKVWAMAALWQTFASERINDVQGKVNSEVEDLLLTYLTKNGTIPLDKLKLKGQVAVPVELQAKVQKITNRARQDVMEKLDSTKVPYQQLLQTPGLGERVRILRRVVMEEKRRLEAKKMLQRLFSSEEKS